VVGKDLKQVKLVTSGAGAAALACLDLLVSLGLPIENIIATDIAGVVYQGRKAEMDPNKARYAKDTKARKLAEVIAGADVFLGLSAPGVLKPEMVRTMAEKPLILALANPTPEIMPEQAREARPDAIIASGRSDYPNQVNNVLCFPFIFRGALDVGATVINEAMKIACVEAIAALAHAEASDIVAAAYGGQSLSFGPEYLIPRPFDPRLIVQIAPAVAKAAMDSGVATRPIEDLEAYRDRLSQFVFRSGLLMKPIFDAARTDPRRLVFAEGEDERVLRAAQQLIDDGLAKPVLVGRLLVVMQRLDRLGLRIKPGRDFELVDPEGDPRFPEYWRLYHSMMERKGVSPDLARNIVRTRNTVIGALMIRRGEAEAMICGTVGRYDLHLEAIGDVIGLRRGVRQFYALNAIILPHGTFFICDTQVMADPTAEQLVDMTLLAVEVVQRFGLSPKVAMLSHSSFGTGATISARKMQAALRLLRAHAPDLEVEGEMQADLAFDEETRLKLFPGSLLKGQANLLIMPTLDAANIALNLFRGVGDGLSVGPILVGAARPAHILTPTARVRGIVNMSALAVVEAQAAAPAGT
jgi:malate dehydrogenase (oxaloacetate-decarboxylating)(NADP+)